MEGLANYVKILPNVDIRTEGGFVVAPNSPGYSWRSPFFAISQLLPFPSSIIPKTEDKKRNGEGWIADALRGLQEGNRDSTFTKVVGRMHYDGYDANSIMLLLSPHAEACNFALSSLERIINHIVKDYPNERQMDADTSDSLHDFLRDSKPIRWIVPPIIGKGTLGFIAGLPETLKTWLMMDLAIGVASGTT